MQTEAETIETAAGPSSGKAHSWLGYLQIAAATFCWSAAATLGKVVFNGHLFAGHTLISPLVITETRTIFAVSMLMPALLLQSRGRLLRIDRRDLASCALIGVLGLAGSNFFYYFAIQKTTLAVAITLQYTAPVWVLLYMLGSGRQRATWRLFGVVLLATVGIVLTLGIVRFGGGSDVAAPSGLALKMNSAGIVAGLLAAFSFAFYNIAGQGVVARRHPLTIMNYSLLSAAVLWLAVNPPWKLLSLQLSLGQWAFLFLFAGASTLLPYILYFNGLKHLDPARAIITGCLEPVFAILFAAVFLQEGLLPVQVLGIVTVLSATVMAQVESA
ncbi:MAG TPA: DMT family transporter [Candidatus Angelobacter sp.]|nr:DMT family transporter [Candidatus Angelobacter sp.]